MIILFKTKGSLSIAMDKLKLTGRTLGQVFYSRRVTMHAMHLLSSVVIQPNLELKTRPIQLLGSLQSDIVLPSIACTFSL